MPEQEIPVEKISLLRKLIKLAAIMFAFVVLGGIFITYQILRLGVAPADFPVDEPITIESGADVRTITNSLEVQQVVGSADLLYLTLVLLYEPTDIKASTYVFEAKLNTIEVAERLVEGDFGNNLIRFTHFEGERVTQIAKRAAEVLPNFDAAEFVEIAEPDEGKLYPETYFLTENFTAEDLYRHMRELFDKTLKPYQEAIKNHTLTLDEILILASIIEREADTPESMRYVSSALQNRLEIGMALQADASIEYVLDKPLAELTPADLEIDTPYNTYLYPGLPPTPIGNPGLEAISAVLQPAESDYFYYITDNDGEFHYAETYQQHLRNIDVYLR
tara:strand:- start:49204 stop:50205 length:1002 start_codon:yes stop_codon:yes gene_type:complete